MTFDAKAAAKTAWGWWRAMQPDPVTGEGDRAAAARLRRAARVADAMMDPAAIDLFRRIGATHVEDLPKVATLAAVLAHVRQDARGKAARLVGVPDGGDKALMSSLRFRRLLEAAPGDEQLTAFRRLAALAGGALPVSDLAESLLNWTDKRRIRWTYDYWNAGQPLSSTQPSPIEDAAS